MSRLFYSGAAAVALALVLSGAHPHAQTAVRYTAAAINMNRGAASSIEIVVDRWSTERERERLMSVMLERGPEKLLDALQDLPRVGYFRTPGALGWDVHYAVQTPQPDGGERVTLI